MWADRGRSEQAADDRGAIAQRVGYVRRSRGLIRILWSLWPTRTI